MCILGACFLFKTLGTTIYGNILGVYSPIGFLLFVGSYLISASIFPEEKCILPNILFRSPYNYSLDDEKKIANNEKSTG